jgi:hypothetical protein
MQMHSIFMDAIATQSCATQRLQQTPVTIGIDYFTRNYNLMADSLTHGQRDIHDFIQLATMQGFTRICEIRNVPTAVDCTVSSTKILELFVTRVPFNIWHD